MPAPSLVVSTPIYTIAMSIIAGEWVIELKISQSVKLRIIYESLI
jgi:hypothetical protein